MNSGLSTKKWVKEEEMYSAREAVRAARSYMEDVYGELDGLNVEEIEFDDPTWIVTMGYWEFLPEPKRVQSGLAAAMLPGIIPDTRKVRRAYKELKINGHSGDVLSMKIRPVPSAEQR
jgi:hypothetical protein